MSLDAHSQQRLAEAATAISWGGYFASHLIDFNELLKTCVLIVSLISTALSARHYLRHYND